MIPVTQASRKLFDLEDKLFEKIYNLKLANIVDAKDLVTDSSFQEEATAYQAVWTTNLRLIFSKIKHLNFHDYSFIDVGCGYGKPSFYATKYDFSCIEGFDFDKRLIHQANKNKNNCRFLKTQKVSFRVGDASDFKLSNKSYIVFLFNPFSSKVMDLFLKNNHHNLKANNSYICYANHHQKSILSHYGFELFWQCRERSLSIWN